MNRYGRQAREHWGKWRPHQLSQIPDPEAFFSSLGLQVETQVDLLSRDLAGDDLVYATSTARSFSPELE